MHETFMQGLTLVLDAKKSISDFETKGCSDEEILKVMAAQKIEWLPPIYRMFLGLIGKEAGEIWKTAVFTFPRLCSLKEQAHKLLDIDGNPILLPEDAFVLLMQDGIIFYYFLTRDKLINPSVYAYSEIEYSHQKVDDKLSEFLLNI